MTTVEAVGRRRPDRAHRAAVPPLGDACARRGHRRRQPAAPLGPRRRRVRPARVRPAGDPDAAPPLAGRGHDRPGRRRHRRRHARPVRQHRRRRRRASIPTRPVATDLANDAFAGMRTFLATAAARGLRGPVKWQFVGPVTLGVALDPRRRARRRARSPSPCGPCAPTSPRSPTPSPRRCRTSPQIVVARRAVVRRADAPRLPDRARPGDRPAVERDGGARAGGHRRRALLRRRRHRLAAGRRPGDAVGAGRARSSPTSPATSRGSSRAAAAIAWGVVPTDGPIPTSSERPWRQLSDVWCELVSRGCDPVLLRQRSLVTPHCGLGLHTPAVADRVVPPDPRDRPAGQRAGGRQPLRPRRLASTRDRRRRATDDEDVAARIAALSELVAYHNRRYHELDDPEISDGDFDLLVRELRELEATHPELVADDSPARPSAARRARCSRPSCTPCR